MRESRPVIVGIDPGTTTGVAVFDLSGNLILVKSGKNLSRSDISRIISDVGNPIIVSSDISPIPRSVERVATSFSARLIEPGETFSRKEKHETAKEYMKVQGKAWKNRHERDALVSGIYAYKQVRQMVERISSKLRKACITDKALANRVMSEVLLKKRNIDSAIKRNSN
jgi:predicted RNase H-like nuclease (RuvC/YqgF family)